MNTGTMRAQGVCKSFGKKAVLRELELTLEPGKIYGLLGRNGAGKTTLLSILTAQLAPDRGSVTYGGEPVWENQAALDHLCFAREAPAAGQTSLRLGHYLRSAAIFYPGWDEGYAHRLLEEFCLDPSRKLSQLSRGQLSMVSVLTALASRAGLTLLDEPTAGLDAVAREQFYRLLLEDFSHTGRTFVLSTHIIGEAAPPLRGGPDPERGPHPGARPHRCAVGAVPYCLRSRGPGGSRLWGADGSLRPGHRTARAVHRPGHAGAAGRPGHLRPGHGASGTSGGVHRPVRTAGRRQEVRT